MADLDAVVRTLLAVAPDQKKHLAHQIIRRARVANRYRKRLRKPHPSFGDGTLISALTRLPRAKVSSVNSAYRHDLALFLAVLRRYEDDQNL